MLQPDEHLRFVTGLHWIVYARALFLVAVAVAAWLFSLNLNVPPNAATMIHVFVLILFVVAGVSVLAAWLRQVGTEIAVTDRRVIYKRGLLTRHTEEMNVARIETVDVEQGLLARLLGYGDVFIRGTGGGIEPLILVAHPLELRSALLAG